MKKLGYLFVFAMVGFCSGCATNYAAKSPAEVAAAIEVKNSDFDSHITIAGPQAFSETRRGIFVDNQTVRLAAVQDKKTGETTYALYVRVLYNSGWRFYESVSFRDGTRVVAKSVDRQVNGCTGVGCIYTEELAVPVELARLEALGNLEFRVNSREGVENVITVQRSYIDGFLTAVRSTTTSP